MCVAGPSVFFFCIKNSPFLFLSLSSFSRQGISKELGDRASEGSACAALASAYQKLQNDDKAMDYLKTCLEVATETDDLVAQAEAAAALGVIYNKRKVSSSSSSSSFKLSVREVGLVI